MRHGIEQSRKGMSEALCIELGPVKHPVNSVTVVKEMVKPVKGVRGVKLDFGFSTTRHLGKGRQAMDGPCKPTDGPT
jgi:hypothetical protein